MKRVSKSLITGVFASGVLAFGLAAPVMADAQGAVGTWSIHDDGQGDNCDGGGSLFGDGIMRGSAHCTFHYTDANGKPQEEVAKIAPTGWEWSDDTHTAVTLESDLIGMKGTVFPIGQAIPVPITLPVGDGGAPVVVGDDYVKINMFN